MRGVERSEASQAPLQLEVSVLNMVFSKGLTEQAFCGETWREMACQKDDRGRSASQIVQCLLECGGDRSFLRIATGTSQCQSTSRTVPAVLPTISARFCIAHPPKNVQSRGSDGPNRWDWQVGS